MTNKSKEEKLREEFAKVFRTHQRDFGYPPDLNKTTNWWLSKFSSHSTELLSKYEVKFMFEKSGQCSSLHRAHPETEWEKGWNSAVEAMLKYLPQPSLEEYNQVISLINQEK